MSKIATYLNRHTRPKLLSAIQRKQEFLDSPQSIETRHFNWTERFIVYTPYVEIIRFIASMFPIRVTRDPYNVDLGLHIVGKPVIIDTFLDILTGLINEIEKNFVRKNGNLSQRLEYRRQMIVETNLVLHLIREQMKRSLSTTIIWKESKHLDLLDEYIESIPTLKTKKKFDAKF